MLRKIILTAAVIALTPAFAIAAPTAMKMTHVTTVQSVKAEKEGIVKHHKTKIVHKIRMERHLKAKAEVLKS